MMVNWDSKFLGKVILHPEVMIPSEKKNRYALISKLGDLRNEWYKAFGDHFSIFKPKVKNIPDKENGSRIFSNGIQPTDDSFLSDFAFFGIGCSQVKIGSEIEFFAFQ